MKGQNNIVIGTNNDIKGRENRVLGDNICIDGSKNYVFIGKTSKKTIRIRN